MTRFAFGAKCEHGERTAPAPARRRRRAARFEQRGQRGRADARRRSGRRTGGGSGAAGSRGRGGSIGAVTPFGDRLVEVQEHAGDHRPGGQLGGVEASGRAATRRRWSSLRAAAGSVAVGGPSWSSNRSPSRTASSSAASAAGAVARRNARAIRASGARRRLRASAARRAARAAST